MLNKAQTFSADFLIASCVFLMITSLVYAYWTYIFTGMEERRFVEDMSEKIHLASQIWFKEGYPIYWSADNVRELGLQNDNKLNYTKILSLEDIGYQKVKTLIGCENYDLFYRLYDQTNYTIFQFGTPPTNAEYVMREKRIGILNESIVLIDVVLWK